MNGTGSEMPTDLQRLLMKPAPIEFPRWRPYTFWDLPSYVQKAPDGVLWSVTSQRLRLQPCPPFYARHLRIQLPLLQPKSSLHHGTAQSGY